MSVQERPTGFRDWARAYGTGCRSGVLVYIYIYTWVDVVRERRAARLRWRGEEYYGS